ncbi:spore cortex biosynthesis protein YabQ [Desulfitobacterium sp. Sab5]|uniref:spore cortex biosynthesis protein YabQ n=1 Tax=Desulfitobacterium nosdiversum TaxID=3375356 RepID=UPI003CEE6AFB
MSEFQAFFWVVMAGVVVGIFFDFYRSLRHWLKWGRISTWAGDLLFSLAALFILFRFFLRANALDFRIYILWGSVLGLFLYLRFLSKLIIKMYLRLFYMISYFFWLLKEGAKIPIRGVFVLMRPPYALLRWFSFLIYRILEAFLAQPLKQIYLKAIFFWERLFPPRTKG